MYTSNTQDNFKAVILAHRASPAASHTAATPPGTPASLAASSAEDVLAAEALATDLVYSLSELLVRETAEAPGGGVMADPEAAAWRSFLEKLTGTGGPLEGLGASGEGQETPAVAAAAAATVAQEGEEALFSEPCDPRALTAGGKEKDCGQERVVVVSENRMLRGELASLRGHAETAGASGGAAEGGRGGRMLVGGAPAAATATAFAECPEVVGTVGEEDFLKIESKWVNVVFTMICVVCAGLAAGLTMGLLSIEPLEMAIKQRSGE